MSITIEPIADIYTDFPEKFGIPRQSGLAESLVSKIVLRPGFNSPDAVRGIEDFSHIWIIWHFSENSGDNWSPTVRPPRLGGNKRMGVFATRSPFRPNNLGLSSVRLLRVEYDENLGPVLYVSGVDLMDKTPIFDIKPYLPFTDSHADAVFGFAQRHLDDDAELVYDEDLLNILPESKRRGLLDVLRGRPAPSYHTDKDRVYKMSFAGFDISFSMDEEKVFLLDIKEAVIE